MIQRQADALTDLPIVPTPQGLARSALLSDGGIESHSRVSLTPAAFILNTVATPTTVRATWAEFLWSEIIEKTSTAQLLSFAQARVDATHVAGAQ